MKFGDGTKEKDPKFPGVILSRTLSFNDHDHYVCIRIGSRCKLLAYLTSKS